MTEAEKIALSEPLAEIFMSMEDDLLRAIAKQIAEGGEINASSEWRLLKLAQGGALTAEAVRIITKYLGSQDEELTRVIAAAALGVIDTLEPAFQQCALDGFVSDASEIPMSAMSAKIISTYRKQAATDLNLVNTVMMYKAGSRYKELVNKIYDEANRQDYLNILGKHTASVVTGAEARQKAVSSCIREFADKGIPAFVDKAGREWSPEAYINMDIRTTVSNTANAAQDAVCDRYGVDLIEVSSHMGARPKCAPYQGKIFSRSNQSGIAHDGNGREIRYEPLSSTSYGQPDGLFGINCRHQKYPFVDGVNFRTYFPYDEAENAKRYKEFQTQRAMERDIRKKKRECMMLEETGDAEALKAARADLRQSKKAYNAYSDEHGLRTREDRLRVERSSGKGAADQSSAKPVLPGGSGGHAVEVSVSGSDNGGNGKLYRDTGLTNGGGNDIMKMGKVSAYKQAAPDFSKYVVSDDASSVDSVRKFLSSEFDLPESDFDFSNIRNAEVLQPFAERLVKIKNETGFSISKIMASDIIDGDELCVSSYKPFEHTLYISSRYFNSKEALADTLKDWANNGVMPKQCRTIQYIAEHEAAHARIPDELIKSDEAVKIWRKRKLNNKNDSDIIEYYADAVAIHRTSHSHNDINIINAINYLTSGGVSV